MIIRTAFQSGANGGAVVIGRVLARFPDRPLVSCNDNYGQPAAEPVGPRNRPR